MQTAAATARRRPGWDFGLYVHAFVAILLTEGFYFHLSGIDPSSLAPQGGDRLAGLAVYAIGLAYGAGVGLLVAGGSLRLRPILPLSLFVLWVGLSALWSIDAYTSLRVAIQLASSFLFAVYISFTRSSNDIARLIFIILVSVILLTLVWAFAVPTYGVHGSIDLYQSVHAGNWRGIYTHKNYLGEVALLATLVAALFGASFVQSRITAIGWTTAAAICLLFSSSRTGIVGAVILMPAMILYLSVVRRLRSAMTFGILNLLILSGAGAALYLSTLVLSQGTLDHFLTGRYSFWQFVGSLLDSGFFLGRGYIAGYRYGVLPYVAALFPNFVPFHPHNGYLDVFIGLGVAGLILLAYAFASASFAAWRLIRSSYPPNRLLGGVAFTIIVVTLFASLTESALMRPGPLTVFLMLALCLPVPQMRSVFQREAAARLAIARATL